ncbi:MAG: CoA pyrophosphatase [Acidobacteriia bacterium]|nr:CoA pyrophosphatase [Terriglobia bacterium]
MAELEAAVAIVHARQPEESVLLMRRAERKGDSWSGHWSFPGGRRDAADIDLLETALRELEEECGIRLRRGQVSAELPMRMARRLAAACVPVTPFVFRADAALPVMLDAREAAAAEWIPLRTLNAQAGYLLPIPGYPPEIRFPGVQLTGAPLWGFTYHLICDWLGMRLEPAARSGVMAAANFILQRLQSLGLPVEPGADGKTADVRGVIPAAAILESLSAPGPHVHSLNRVEIYPDRIRVVGREFEEYLIRGTGVPA